MEKKNEEVTFEARLDEEELNELIRDKKFSIIKREISEMNEVDIAELLDPLEAPQALLIFRMLPKDLAAEVFAHFSKEQQMAIINAITDKEVEEIVQDLYFDDMIDLLEEMPANIVKRVLKSANADERKLINQFLKYPEDSAGSIMTIEYVHLKKESTVAEALRQIKETGIDKETVYTCYVTDEKRLLEGIVSLRKIVISDEDAKIKDIMEPEVIFVNTYDDQETAAAVFKKYGFIALPVVDNERRLTGIITVDDIIDVIEQEATEDFQIMAAMKPTEDEYLDTGVFKLAWNRLPWLLILMISATVTGSIMGKFEETIAQVAILATFIPMIMDTGGNTGSQSSTLIIRGLATGEIETGDWFKVLWKELRISLIIGSALSMINFVRMYFFLKTPFSVTLTVCLTLVFTISLAKLVGGMLPLLAKKLKLDPAIMAGPLITTVVDALALIVYFRVAHILLDL